MADTTPPPAPAAEPAPKTEPAKAETKAEATKVKEQDAQDDTADDNAEDLPDALAVAKDAENERTFSEDEDNEVRPLAEAKDEHGQHIVGVSSDFYRPVPKD